MPNEKIAIVSSGGGMCCSYAGGVFAALAKEYKFTSPDIIIATSGSAGTAAYYLAEQYNEIKQIWTQFLSKPEFISFARFWRILDVHYLIDDVFKKEVPLNVGTFSRTQTNWLIPVYGVVTKKNRYITQSDGYDIFEVLRAAKAIPVFFNGRVNIGGVDFIDGAIGTTFERTIEDARAYGATKIIAIDARPSRKRRQLLRNSLAADVILISNDGLQAGRVTRNRKVLESSYGLGYEDALHSTELQRLLV